jgi:hypothetical protein
MNVVGEIKEPGYLEVGLCRCHGVTPIHHSAGSSLTSEAESWQLQLEVGGPVARQEVWSPGPVPRFPSCRYGGRVAKSSGV